MPRRGAARAALRRGCVVCVCAHLLRVLCFVRAQVTLTPAERVSFEPHPLHDPQDFTDLGALAGPRASRGYARHDALPLVFTLSLTRAAAERVSRNGFYGGVRLLWAICAKARATAQLRALNSISR